MKMKYALLLLFLISTLRAEMKYDLQTQMFYTSYGTDQITVFGYDQFVRLFSYLYWEHRRKGMEDQIAFNTAKKDMVRLVGANCTGVRIFLGDLKEVESWSALIRLTAAPDYDPKN